MKIAGIGVELCWYGACTCTFVMMCEVAHQSSSAPDFFVGLDRGGVLHFPSSSCMIRGMVVAAVIVRGAPPLPHPTNNHKKIIKNDAH